MAKKVDKKEEEYIERMAKIIAKIQNPRLQDWAVEVALSIGFGPIGRKIKRLNGIMAAAFSDLGYNAAKVRVIARKALKKAK